VNCLSVLESLSDYLDDDLEEDAGDEIDLHLGGCPSCQAFVNTMQRTVELCRDTIVPPLPAEEKAALCGSIWGAKEPLPKKGKGKKKG